MSAFVDKVLLQLRDPAKVKALLAPQGDATFAAIKALFAAMYDLPAATLHSVKSIEVLSSELERPIFVPERRTGTWTRTIPEHQRTDVVYEGTNGMTPHWVDVVTAVRATVVLDADPGEVDTITAESIDDFTSIAQFQAKFRFIDIAAFMAEHDLTTVADLKRHAHYLLAEVKLKAPPPFAPGDAANERRFDLQLAILIRDTVDLAAALREAKLTLALLDHALAFPREVEEAEVRAPLAPIVIFPDNALPAGTTAAEVKTFFAGERVLALLTPP
jgi:voltage-gated potassium channel Kch